MTAITPGTWTALKETGLDPNEPYWAIRSSVVHHCYDGRPYLALIAICGYESDGPQEGANARLMAASKDLFDACDGLLDVLDYIGRTLPEDTIIPIFDGILIEEKRIAAEVAIHKARGTVPGENSASDAAIDPFPAEPLDIIAGGMAEGGDGE